MAHSGVPEHFTALKIMDPVMNSCEGRISIVMRPDYFFEIENNHSGTEQYNQIVKYYRKKNWDVLDEKIETFLKEFENSPLVEAVQFLQVHIEFEKINPKENTSTHEAEKRLREILLLYPKSSLTANLLSSIGTFWIAQENYQKALSVFQTAKQEYPFHDQNCLFLVGSAEAHFFLRDYKTAQREYLQVTQKCTIPRIKFNAEVRLLELKSLLKNGVPDFEKLYHSETMMVQKYSPAILFNLGELKYQKKDYKTSSFYFTEFLKYGSSESACTVSTYKRLADILLRNNDSTKKVVGAYFAVFDKYPETQIGKFSQIFGYLIEWDKLSDVEKQRRIEIIDTLIAKMDSDSWQRLSYVAKGLAVLQSGERDAFEYLVKLEEISLIDMKKGEEAVFIREKLQKIIETEVRLAADSTRLDINKDREILESLEKTYLEWIKGTVYEMRTKRFYEEIVISRFNQSMSNKDYKNALEKLASWMKSSLWPEKGVSFEVKNKISQAITNYLIGIPPQKLEKTAKISNQYTSVFDAFLVDDYKLLKLAVLIPVDENKVKNFFSVEKNNRLLAGSTSSLTSKQRSYLSLIKGRALAAIQENKKAQNSLMQVKEAPFYDLAVRERVLIYRKTKETDKLFSVFNDNYKIFTIEEQKELLLECRSNYYITKNWKMADKLFKAATRLGLKEKELAPFNYYKGRSYFENKKFNLSVNEYEAALKLDPDATEKNESKFRLGKSYSKLKKTVMAKKILEEVAAEKDEFWSKMASNEIQLMENK